MFQLMIKVEISVTYKNVYHDTWVSVCVHMHTTTNTERGKKGSYGAICFTEIEISTASTLS